MDSLTTPICHMLEFPFGVSDQTDSLLEKDLHQISPVSNKFNTPLYGHGITCRNDTDKNCILIKHVYPKLKVSIDKDLEKYPESIENYNRISELLSKNEPSPRIIRSQSMRNIPHKVKFSKYIPYHEAYNVKIPNQISAENIKYISFLENICKSNRNKLVCPITCKLTENSLGCCLDPRILSTNYFSSAPNPKVFDDNDSFFTSMGHDAYKNCSVPYYFNDKIPKNIIPQVIPKMFKSEANLKNYSDSQGFESVEIALK